MKLHPEFGFFSCYRGGGEIHLKFMKGIVKVILSDPLCKEGNARFTTVPLNQLYLIVILRFKVFHSELITLALDRDP